MIDLATFASCIWQEHQSKLSRLGYANASDIPHDLDMIGAGILDSFDLLNLSLLIEQQYCLGMDFSIFSEGFDATLPGLYSSLSSASDAAGAGAAAESATDRLTPISQALTEAGIRAGDVLMLHSSMANLMLDGAHPCETLYAAIRNLIGPDGTILAPAANTQAFLEGAFDPQSTPVQADLGIFSEYLRGLPGAVRSSNAFDSVVGVGRQAADICGADEPVCYGENSPWKRMLGHDTKLVLLGVDFYIASIVHAAELDSEVPYRAWKDFPGRIVDNGRERKYVVRLYAAARGIRRLYQRILDLPSMAEHIARLNIQGGGFSAPLDTVYDACMRAIADNPNVFVETDGPA